MPPLMTDEQVARAALEHTGAFATLIARYESKLGRYLERLGLLSKEDREDVLQNAFIKAYRNLASFDPELSFSSWMYRIAHNEAMTFFRARRARPQVYLAEGSEHLLEYRDESADTTALAEEHLSAAELSRALAALPAKYRDVLMLRFFEERSYAEMSDILEMPVGTVSTLIHRARKALKAALKGRLS